MRSCGRGASGCLVVVRKYEILMLSFSNSEHPRANFDLFIYLFTSYLDSGHSNAIRFINHPGRPCAEVARDQ